MPVSAPKVNTPSHSPRTITREELDHLRDPLARLVWEKWLNAGEAVLEGQDA